MRYTIPAILFLFVLSCKPTQSFYSSEIAGYGFEKTDTLVDIGSGYGYYDVEILNRYPHLYIVLEDIDEKYRKLNEATYTVNGEKHKLKDQSEIHIGTDTSIPLASAKYKTVLCRRTLHEFKSPAKMADELRRITAANGVLIIEEPIPKFEGHKDPICKQKYWTKEEISSLMEAHHFKLASSSTTGNPVKDNKEIDNLSILKFTPVN